jgi:catechol 2,3-dioxygenase-like lactoylglutathione lyase family enzyme
LTDDLDSEFKRLSAMGVHPTTPPATLVEGTPIRAMYCRDPNGLLVQMLQLPADWPHVFGTKVAGVHHVGLVVSDLERSIAWYESKLGLSIEALHDNSGPTVSDMFELPDTEERAALAPAGPCGLEIMTWTHPQGRPYTRARTDLGAMHLAFAVADPVEARTALVADDPTELRSYMHPSAPNRQGFNLEDPDGIPIEILEPAPNPR